MKFIIVFACIFALAFAQHHGDHHEHHSHEHDAKTIHHDAEVNVEDFKYAYETDNHIKAHQAGHLHDKDNWIVEGAYEYESPEGHHIHVTYKADEHGYQPVVHH